MNRISGLFLSALSFCAVASAPAAPWVTEEFHDGDFKLAEGETVAPILIAADDFKVVQIAANLLAEDIGRVTGHNGMVQTDAAKVAAPAVIAGTLGKNPVIDKLAADGKIDVSKLAGQWESFLITTVANPLPGMDSALVIVGSDRRGTAYGIFELSQAIGVSPWYWWADVKPLHKRNLSVAAGTRRFGPPSVRYRGIFINDEDWGLHLWSGKTFEPEAGGIGPKTYAKVFELLLRLKANTLWPAMHEVSKAFNDFPENKVIADNYGIVMGASHCEPMLRNNVGEWPKDSPRTFNFITNPEGVTKYWEDRVADNGKYENIYTLGMRGIHDSPMMGPRTAAEHVAALEKIFGVQRGLLAKYVNPDPAKVPQIFCPYKEVLGYYLNGLQIPPDVTLVFPDDNYGYIRYFPTPAQIAERPGGFGLYYHISYLGNPFSYVWLNTTPPALIWEEMSKAYAHGMRQFWMLNVGDIKPGEIGIDLFMEMAWDIQRWNLQTLPDFLTEWAERQFGPEFASPIGKLLDDYYRLGFQRKPEHLQWNLRGEAPRPSDFSPVYYHHELYDRFVDYARLEAGAAKIMSPIPNTHALPSEQRDGYFETVGYPLMSAALANMRVVANELVGLSLAHGRADVTDWMTYPDIARVRLLTLTADFNKVAGGKWREVMPNDVLQTDRSYRAGALVPAATNDQIQLPEAPGIGVLVEGRAQHLQAGETAALPVFDPYTERKAFLQIFGTGRQNAYWTVTPDADWIVVDTDFRMSSFGKGQHLDVSIDWAKAPRGPDVSGNIIIATGNETITVQVPVYNPAELRPEQLAGRFVEHNGVVSILAQDYSRKHDRISAAWEVIPGLGRTGNAVGVFPTTAPSVDVAQAAAQAPSLEYDFYVFRPGNITINYNLIPTHPILYGSGLQFAVAVDDAPPQLVTLTAGTGNETGTSRTWQLNVVNNTTTGSSTHVLAAAGPHTLKIYGVNPGVLIEKIVMDAGGLRPSYLGPPETRVTVQK